MQVNLGSFNDKVAYRQNHKLKNDFHATATPNFGKTSAEVMKECAYGIDKKLKFLEKFESWKGELGSILITAFGTGMVAPFVIAFNPIAQPKPDATKKEKEDYEKMKKYTAMRQPVSAVLSLIIQASLVKPVGRLLDTVSNTARVSKYLAEGMDMSNVHSDAYIAKNLLTEEDKINYVAKTQIDLTDKINYVAKEKLKDSDTNKYLEKITALKTKAQKDEFIANFNKKTLEERNKEVAKWVIERDNLEAEWSKDNNKTIAKWKIANENLEKKWKKDKYKDIAKWKSDSYYNKQVAQAMLADKEGRLVTNAGAVSNEDISEFLKEKTAKMSADEKRVFEDAFNQNSKEIQKNQVSQWKIAKGKNVKYANKEIMNNVVENLIDSYLKDIDKNLKYHERGRAFYNERAKILIDNEKVLSKILDPELIKGKIASDTSGKQLKEYFEGLLKTEKNEEIRTIISEILEREDANLMQSRCIRTLDRIKYVKDVCDGKFDANRYSVYIDSHDKVLNDLENGLKDLKKSETRDIPSVIDKITTLLQDVKNNSKFGSVLQALGIKDLNDEKSFKEKVAKDIVGKYKEYASNFNKGTSTWMLMLMGIFVTLPITCTLLNWAYPRFMEIFFPDLAGSKKTISPNEQKTEIAQGGKKCH